MSNKSKPSLRGGNADAAIQPVSGGEAGLPRSARNDDNRDIFNTKWIVIGVIVASLLIPLLSGCGVKGELKHPAQKTEQR